MPMQILWTALPNGVVAGTANTLRLSVLVSPRLSTVDGADGRLGEFDAFRNWAEVIEHDSTRWAVNIGGVLVPAARRTSPRPAPNQLPGSVAADPALWSRIFDPDTVVRSWTKKTPAGRLVRSYPVRHIAGFLQKQYTAFATASPDEHPPVAALLAPDALNPVGYRRGTRGASVEGPMLAALEGQQSEGAIPNSPTPSPEKDFLQLKRFHRPAPANAVHHVPTRPVPDFHQLVATLGEHIALMRWLGLIVDLEFENPAPSRTPVSRSVRVVPDYPFASTDVDLTPLTRVAVGGGAFQAIAGNNSRGKRLANGYVRLDTPDTSVIDFDHDGAAIKAMQLAETLQRSQHNGSTDSPARAALPALRSAGLTVAAANRAVQLHEGLTRTNTLHDAVANGSGELFAEDLVRGYRFDVWTQSKQSWRSLTARRIRYTFRRDNTTLAFNDEGYVGTGATSSSVVGAANDFFVPETLMRWAGWSLSVPRPGRTMGHDDTGVRMDTFTSRNGDVPINEAPFSTFPTARALPILRFGETYRVRARVVDLAGNDVGFVRDTPATDTAAFAAQRASAPLRYGRFEPVPSPVALLRDRPGEKETVGRIVLYSDWNTPDADIAATDRHILPDKGAQLLAEVDGRFDRDGAPDPSIAVWREIGNRDQRDLGPDATEAAVFSGDGVPVPYLPDPHSVGARFRNLWSVEGPAAVSVPFREESDRFLDARSFRVRVMPPGGLAGPEVRRDEHGYLLVVPLPKAEVREVSLSSYLFDADVDKFGLVRWMQEYEFPPELRELVVRGDHWAITPHKTLELVHAVRRPLALPVFRALLASRQAGRTYATITDTRFQFHRASTGKLDLHAKWTEPEDRGPGAPAPVPAKPYEAHLPVKIDRDLEDLADPAVDARVRERHEFGNTKYRSVTYTAEATSKFTDFFVEHDRNVTLGATPHALPGAAGVGLVTGSVVVKSPDRVTTYRPGVDFGVDHEAGTVTRGQLSAIPAGAPVDIDFLRRPVSRMSGARTLVVRSSARPARPGLDTVVPAFTWSSSYNLATRVSTSTRTACLRVYLDRPWWSSGDGELLGVVLFAPSTATPAPSEALNKLVTRWGADPTYASADPALWPAATAFTSRVATATGLTLAEVPGAAVTVAGHAVTFDSDRDQWYTDIDFAPGGYYPFVRLALARYQPNSLTDYELSPVAVADFLQLAPKRTVTLDPRSDPPTVRVAGMSFTATEDGISDTSTMRASVEIKDSAFSDPDLGWSTVRNRFGSPAYTKLAQAQTTSANKTWAAQVPLPADRPAGRYRLVIEEIEEVRVDGRPPPGPDQALNPTHADRRVYTDIIPI